MASLSVARCLCPADAIAGSHRPRGRPAVDPVDPVDPALPNPACYGSNRHSLRLSWANPGDLQSGVGHGIALFPSSCGASSLRRLSAVDCCTLVSLFFSPSYLFPRLSPDVLTLRSRTSNSSPASSFSLARLGIQHRYFVSQRTGRSLGCRDSSGLLLCVSVLCGASGSDQHRRDSTRGD